MKIHKTAIEGVLVIEPSVFEDARGYFYESYNESVFQKAGIDIRFVQDNQSRSDYGVVRGLHMQRAPHSQTKLLRVLEGTVFDVALDLRRDSPTFGSWYGLELSAENRLQLLIPKGFCHGFSVLSEHATVFYKCDALYHKESETGIRYNDPDLNIDWKVPQERIVVSEKDSQQPLLSDFSEGNG